MKAQHGVSQKGDLQKNTWSFKMNEPLILASGDFSIMKHSQFTKILEILRMVETFDDLTLMEKNELSNEANIIRCDIS